MYMMYKGLSCLTANGTIDFQEFSAFMEKLQDEQGTPEEQKEKMKETLKEFQKLDTDGKYVTFSLISLKRVVCVCVCVCVCVRVRVCLQ